LANNQEPARTRTFEFEPHQITVADAALLLDMSNQDVQALIRTRYLRAEGKRPYKIDIRSIVEYKRAMPSNIEEEDEDED